MFAEVQDCPLRCQHHRTVEQLVYLATFGHCILFCSSCLFSVLGIPLSVWALLSLLRSSSLARQCCICLIIRECNIQLFRVFRTVFKNRFEFFGSLSFLKSFNQFNSWVLTVYYVVTLYVISPSFRPLPPSLVGKYIAIADSLTCSPLYSYIVFLHSRSSRCFSALIGQ